MNCAKFNSIDHLYWKRLEHPNIKFITKVKEGLFIKSKLDKLFPIKFKKLNHYLYQGNLKDMIETILTTIVEWNVYTRHKIYKHDNKLYNKIYYSIQENKKLTDKYRLIELNKFNDKNVYNK